MRKLITLLKDESGASAIEYAAIGALIAIAAVAAMTTTGTKLSTASSTVGSSVSR